jgi:serine/threonine protein kinase
MTQDGQAKVADFGLARARAALTIADIDGSGKGTIVADSNLYTPAYCSMEQLNGETLTRRTDIYSWAASLLEMFLGERPWPLGTVIGAAREDYFSMDMRLPMPRRLKDLLWSCLDPLPKRRPKDFQAIDADLSLIYREAVGEEYPREISQAAADTADTLNNRALSFLDLRKPTEALACWKKP